MNNQSYRKIKIAMFDINKKNDESFEEEKRKALADINSNDKYVAFWGSCFSNFYPAKFYLDGKEWKCSEQYFMYMKAITFNDTEIAQEILNNYSPKVIKALGRKVKGFSSEVWDKVKCEFMYKAVKAKFTQSAICNECIKEFPTQKFVEGSPVDTIWGVGIHYSDDKVFDETNWRGQNLLGNILTKVRDEIFNDAFNAMSE